MLPLKPKQKECAVIKLLRWLKEKYLCLCGFMDFQTKKTVIMSNVPSAGVTLKDILKVQSMENKILYKKDFLVRGKDVRTKADGPYSNGKYAGWIDLYVDEKLETSMFCTGPIYSTEKDAIKELEPIAAEIRRCQKT